MNQIHNDEASDNSAEAAMRQLMGLTVTLGTVMEKGMNALGLSRSRAQLLWEMTRLGPVTQRELATALSVTPRNVTGLVDALEEAGLVERRPHPTDRRAALVVFTEAGGELAGNMRGALRDWGAALFADLSETDRRDFTATLEKLHAKLLPALDSASTEARELKRGDKTALGSGHEIPRPDPNSNVTTPISPSTA